MVQIDVTKVSSKGQIVIPSRMRGRFKEGETLVVIDNGEQLILKKESGMDKQLIEDLEFARRTEEAYKQIERGEYTSYAKEEFLKKLRHGKDN